MKTLFSVMLLAASSVFASVDESVAILYSQDVNGGMNMVCSATAIVDSTNRNPKTTSYLTAAHCVTETDLTNPGRLKPTTLPLYLSNDKVDHKDYVRATIVRVGDAQKGYDFAILDSELKLPALSLGDERLEAKDVRFVNVAAPLGIGKATFFGRVALPVIDRPLIEGDINWSGAMLVDVVSEGGSSGSTIVSLDTNKVIGIIVGHYSSLKIAVPISRVKETPNGHELYPTAALLAIRNASASPGVK